MDQSVGSGGDQAGSRLRGWRVVGAVVGVTALAVLATLIFQSTTTTPSAQATSTVPGTATPQAYTSVADMSSHQPFYIAHRGGSRDWPEMSLTAYENAANWGMGALEVSVARTADGEFFGLHDKTIDRTSEVSGDIDPTTLTWSNLTTNYKNKLNASSAEGENYTRVADIFAKFAANHVIFVDTKYIGDTQQRTDLINTMLSYAPASHWVLKGYYDDVALTDLAGNAGIQTWGYYYAKDLPQLDSTAGKWDMLGLEVEATQDDWTRVKAKGKPVIAFFIEDKSQQAEALAKGANGLMVSGVPATLGTPLLAVPGTETGAGIAPQTAKPKPMPPVKSCRVFQPVVRRQRHKVRICVRGPWTAVKLNQARAQATRVARLRAIR